MGLDQDYADGHNQLGLLWLERGEFSAGPVIFSGSALSAS
jgi:hypothetical protein